jgi:hypothetical protein
MIILGEFFHKKNFPETMQYFLKKSIPYFSIYHWLSNIKIWKKTKFLILPRFLKLVCFILTLTLKHVLDLKYFCGNYSNTFKHAEFKSEIKFPLRRPAVFSQTAILSSLISQQIFSLFNDTYRWRYTIISLKTTNFY